MMNDFSVDMNEYLPLRDVVFNTLRKAILKGELKPGERLMEIALAERLGVSRTPVREAMRKLELEGLVVMIPRRGAQVANITEKDLNDVLEVRRALDALGAELACERITGEEIRELKKADVGVLAEIYAARESNTIGISSADLAAQIPGAIFCETLQDVTNCLRKTVRQGDIVVTMGAGDIFRAGEALLADSEK